MDTGPAMKCPAIGQEVLVGIDMDDGTELYCHNAGDRLNFRAVRGEVQVGAISADAETVGRNLLEILVDWYAP